MDAATLARSRAAAAATLDRMSVPEKVGQVFVAAVGTHSPNAHRLPSDLRTPGIAVRQDGRDLVAAQIVEHHLGGICYFPRTPGGDDPAWVRDLVDELQSHLPVSAAPLLVTADQEGGTVARLRRGATGVPGAMALAATGDVAAAHEAARLLALDLRAVGITQDYAPVADVNVDPANPVIGVRSFGSDPEVVAGYVAAQVRGLRSAGVAATVKHFPGHGDTSVDSHLGLPTVTHDVDTWTAVDVPPFAAAIEAGVDAVMTAHLAMPALDPSGDPATLSRPIIDGALRGRLGFDGVVVTDALDMAGARERYGDAEAAVRALLAGADQLLMPFDLGVAVSAVLDAVGSGRVPPSRLDAAVLRVLTLKFQLGLFDGAAVPTGQAGQADRRRSALDLALRGITVLGRPAEVLPLGGSTGPIALVGCLSTGASALEPVLAARSTVESVETGSNPESAAVARAAAVARHSSLAVVVTRSASRWPGQRDLLAAVESTGTPYIQVSIREPYDAGLVGGASAHVLTYGDGAVSIDALGQVLTGRAKAGGTLPVDVPGPDGQVRFSRGLGA